LTDTIRAASVPVSPGMPGARHQTVDAARRQAGHCVHGRRIIADLPHPCTLTTPTCRIRAAGSAQT
jgi:hypothetical protein